MLPFIEATRRLGREPVVVSEKWHLDLATGDGRPLRTRLTELGIEPVDLAELDPASLAPLVRDGAAGLLVNALWMVRRPVLELFAGRLFNYHNARLPEERGAAAYSWKILSRNREGGLAIHAVTERLDDGDIVVESRLPFPEGCRTCADFYRFMAPYEVELFERFITALDEGSLVPRRQDETASLYWPRLNTDLHGYVDWSWTADEIAAFVDAFDAPHPGASTFLDEIRVRLRGCRSTTKLGRFHPFQAGLIIRKAAHTLFIAARGGAVEVRDVVGENKQRLNDSVRLGTRFFTPVDLLEKARRSRVAYRATGVSVIPGSRQ
jgi:methionyl-tRNA formyltransferase